jgi:DNA polymerase III subunit delta'
MTQAASLLKDIFEGSLSHKAQGFLVLAPQGFTLNACVAQAMRHAYGTAQHPDIRVLSPEGKGDLITVDAVREAQTFLSSSASGTGMKTLLILSADKMNEPAANALLKPLEEPGRTTRIVLITDTPSALPATIRSRCALYALSGSQAEAEAEVRAQLDAEQLDQARLQAALIAADGNPTLAAAILQHDLDAWAEKVGAWLSGTDPTPPLPVLTGKQAIPLTVVAQALQSLLVTTLRDPQCASISGWSAERAAEAAWIAVCGLEDIRRAGIDAKTRLHSLLVRIRKESVSAAI